MRNKIRLDTSSDVREFIKIVDGIPSNVKITVSDGTGDFIVNGRSFLGLLYASAEFPELWIETDQDIYDKIMNFVTE